MKDFKTVMIIAVIGFAALLVIFLPAPQGLDSVKTNKELQKEVDSLELENTYLRSALNTSQQYAMSKQVIITYYDAAKFHGRYTSYGIKVDSNMVKKGTQKIIAVNKNLQDEFPKGDSLMVFDFDLKYIGTYLIGDTKGDPGVDILVKKDIRFPTGIGRIINTKWLREINKNKVN